MRAYTLVVTGLPGVGKSTLCQALAVETRGVAVNSGDLLRTYLRERGLPLSDELNTGDVFVARFGEALVGEVIADAAIALGAGIIDGVRLFSTIPALESRGRPTAVIFVTAPAEVRRARFLAREQAEALEDLPSAELRLVAKDRWAGDLDQFLVASRWRFHNDGSLDNLRNFARTLASDLQGA